MPMSTESVFGMANKKKKARGNTLKIQTKGHGAGFVVGRARDEMLKGFTRGKEKMGGLLTWSFRAGEGSGPE